MTVTDLNLMPGDRFICPRTRLELGDQPNFSWDFFLVILSEYAWSIIAIKNTVNIYDDKLLSFLFIYFKYST